MMVTNEKRVEYQKILGFEAIERKSGWYRINVHVEYDDNQRTTLKVCDATAEEFLQVWKGVRSLAETLTNDQYTCEI